jgi:hypothetical protein
LEYFGGQNAEKQKKPKKDKNAKSPIPRLDRRRNQLVVAGLRLSSAIINSGV